MSDNPPQYPVPASDAALRDADLAALVQAGRLHAAFEGIMARYESKVFHLCTALLRDTPSAEHIAQESFLRIWRALASYNPENAALSTWIYAITRNRCLTELTRRPHSTPIGVNGDAAAELLDAAQPAEDRRAMDVLRGLVESLPASPRPSCLMRFAHAW